VGHHRKRGRRKTARPTARLLIRLVAAVLAEQHDERADRTPLPSPFRGGIRRHGCRFDLYLPFDYYASMPGLLLQGE
jgi:hypothetical protein